MKKVLSVLMSMFLLFTVCIPAFEVKTVLDKETGVLTLTISVPAGTDLATLESTLTYDAAKLELTDVVYGAGDMTTANKDTAGAVRLFMVWAASQTDCCRCRCCSGRSCETQKTGCVIYRIYSIKNAIEVTEKASIAFVLWIHMHTSVSTPQGRTAFARGRTRTTRASNLFCGAGDFSLRSE